MKILIIGSGAREHAMAWAVARNPSVNAIFVAPGNGGTAMTGGRVTNIGIGATQIEELLEFAEREGIDLTVVGPEQPLELGIVNRFRSAGIPVVGPTREAARLETSKVFAKDFMKRHGIPTADYHVYDNLHDADTHINSPSVTFPQVIKASGLCAGKGVVVVDDRQQALSVNADFFQARIFGDAAREVVYEEFLTGQEASVFVLTDGKSYRLFLPAQDHKRIGEGDTGKNTGGMGAYAPAPLVTPDVMKKVEERIIMPTLQGMAEEGCPYTGFLYIGLMIDRGEPSVVEYNARLGDPETQVVLPLLKSDFVEALQASLEGRLLSVPFEMHDKSAATVVIASAGYPDAYDTGKAVSLDPSLDGMEEVLVFHAGTRIEQDRVVTSGGRVFSVTAQGDSLNDALERAYRAVAMIGFDGAYYRRDIGAKAALSTNQQQ
jgi:phosphoribosylamine--glycine ligase